MTQDLLWEGKSANLLEVTTAVALAKEAQAEWTLIPINERIKVLLKFRDQLSHCKDSFAKTISKETGKPLWESHGEVAAMMGKIEISIKAQEKRHSDSSIPFNKSQLRTRHKPLGVCAVFGPFNFPAHLPNGHIIPALLAGNSVVFKPSELTPLVAEEMLKLWKKAGLMEGVITLVQGGAETGKALASQKNINALFFTGSWKTGKQLAKQFASHPEKLLALEMGGNNPLVIGQIIDYKAAAYEVIQSAYITSGQRCTCARRLVVTDGQEEIIEHLSAMIPKIKVGTYTETPEPFMGPVITNDAANSLLQTQEELLTMGANSIIPMQRIKDGTPLLNPGLIDVTNINQLPDEEMFGPLLQVIRVPDFETALDVANDTQYGLAAGLFSDSQSQYDQFFQKIDAGIINWNTQTTGASSAAPFGGIGHSGNYRPSAYYAADYCNYPVASIECNTLTLPEKLSPGIHL